MERYRQCAMKYIELYATRVLVSRAHTCVNLHIDFTFIVGYEKYGLSHDDVEEGEDLAQLECCL